MRISYFVSSLILFAALYAEAQTIITLEENIVTVDGIRYLKEVVVAPPEVPKNPWPDNLPSVIVSPAQRLSRDTFIEGAQFARLTGDSRGIVGDVRGVRGTQAEPIWVVADETLVIDATNDAFGLRLRNCEWINFYNLRIKAEAGDGIDILEGCKNIRFVNCTVTGGNFGFMANQTSGNVIANIHFKNCLAEEQTGSNFYAGGVFGKWGYENCVGRNNRGKTDRSQIFYISAMNSAPYATNCTAINGPMTGFQFRSGVTAKGLLVADCASGILLGGLDGFEPEQFKSPKTGTLIDSVVVRSHGTPSGQWFHKGIEAQNGEYTISNCVVADTGTGVDVNGITDKKQRIAIVSGASNIMLRVVEPIRTLNGGICNVVIGEPMDKIIFDKAVSAIGGTDNYQQQREDVLKAVSYLGLQ